jgi:hypothetical protein
LRQQIDNDSMKGYDMNHKEPYISNRTLHELRRLLEDRNDPTINQFLAEFDIELDSRTVSKSELDSMLDSTIEVLNRLEAEEDALSQLAKDRFYPEPKDLYVWSDTLNDIRLNLVNCIDSLVGWINGEGDECDAIYRRQQELEAAEKAAKAKSAD